MKKVVWIINHYAGDTFFNKGGRHYWIAKYLKKSGYEPVVFCCNNKHNPGNEAWFDTNALSVERIAEDIGVPYVFVKGRRYTGNGKQRILNMYDFYRNILKVTRSYAEKNGCPDIVYSSSVHPLSLVAGNKIARRYGVKSICEVRDLWPESLVAYGLLRESSLLAKALYAGEKRIYKRADLVIMTWPGGYDYIIDKGWEKEIPRKKVKHISNGVDLDEYLINMKMHKNQQKTYENCREIRCVYTGSIRKVNNIGMLIEAAEILKERGVDNIRLFIFGAGDERDELEAKVKEKSIENVSFMGLVPKAEIPDILSKADINILHNRSTSLDKYGQSQNKLFEYLASGRPVLMTYKVGHSIIREEKCGIEVEKQSPETIADAIQLFFSLPDKEIENYRKRAFQCAAKYDFKKLTGELVNIIEEI